MVRHCLEPSGFALILLLPGIFIKWTWVVWCIHQPVLILSGMFSKSPINQATSRATLTQMLSIVFRQMESNEVWDISSSTKFFSWCLGGESDTWWNKYKYSLFYQASSLSPGTEDGLNSNVSEVSFNDHPILSVKHLNNTPVSIEGIQSFVGSTDIKVYSWQQHDCIHDHLIYLFLVIFHDMFFL